MKTRFNWSVSTREFELVLAGEYDDSELEQLSQFFLDNLSRVTELDSQPALIKVSDLRGKYTVWQDATSASPSGRHLGHFKLLFRDIDQQLKEEEREQLQGIQEAIAKC